MKKKSSLDEKRELTIHQITSDEAEQILTKIKYYNDIDTEKELPRSKRTPIIIYLNSTGGDLTAAFTMIDAIKGSTTPIEIVNIGTAYNEAFYVFLAAEKRFAYPRSSFMLSKAIRPFRELSESYQDFANKQSLELKALVLDKTKISDTEYSNISKELWMTAEDAFNVKVCTEVLRNTLK